MIGSRPGASIALTFHNSAFPTKGPMPSLVIGRRSDAADLLSPRDIDVCDGALKSPHITGKPSAPSFPFP